MKIHDTIINAECVDILNELRRQLSINGIPYLQKIKDSGDNIMVQCPYHGNGQERNPSAGIHKKTGIFHCFACGETHTLPEVVSYCFGYKDVLGKEGRKWLIKNFATVRIEERKDIELDISRKHTVNKDKTFISEEELDSYRYYHNYWKERGIIDEDVIELFDLGYDINTKEITMPVRDINGNCLFIARRRVDIKRFSYPKDVEKPLYGLYELSYTGMRRFADKIFVTESMIDALLLWQAGHIAVALNGTGSELQYAQLRQLPCRHLVLATDNDKAGQSARHKIRQNVNNKIFTEIIFPDGVKDIGDLGKEKLFGAIKDIERWEGL